MALWISWRRCSIESATENLSWEGNGRYPQGSRELELSGCRCPISSLLPIPSLAMCDTLGMTLLPSSQIVRPCQYCSCTPNLSSLLFPCSPSSFNRHFVFDHAKLQFVICGRGVTVRKLDGRSSPMPELEKILQIFANQEWCPLSTSYIV